MRMISIRSSSGCGIRNVFHDQAVEEILKEKGKQFDPVIVEILQNIEDDFRRIKHDFPDDGKRAVHLN